MHETRRKEKSDNLWNIPIAVFAFVCVYRIIATFIFPSNSKKDKTENDKKKWIFVCNFCRAIFINMDMELRAPNAYNIIVDE